MKLRFSLVAVAILLLSLTSFGKTPYQERPKDASAADKPVATRPAELNPTPSHELAQTSKEAAAGKHETEGKKPGEEEDEEAQFKYSASVKWIARHTGLSDTAAYWLFVLINFGVIAGLAFRGLQKALPGYFRSRNESIQKNLEEARKASEEANRRLSEIENRLSRLDSEINGIRAEAENAAKAEEETLRQQTEEERQKIVSNSQQEIAAAASAARRDLKSYAAELAVSLAEKKINVDEATDKSLLRDFVGQLGKDGR